MMMNILFTTLWIKAIHSASLFSYFHSVAVVIMIFDSCNEVNLIILLDESHTHIQIAFHLM